MGRPGGVLQQDDSGLVVASIVERACIEVQTVAALAAIADHGPCRDDALPAWNSQCWNAWPGIGLRRLNGIAKGEGSGLAAAQAPAIDVSPPAPTLERTVVVAKLDHEVVAGPVAECDIPGSRLRRLRSGAVTRRQVLTSVGLTPRGHYGSQQHDRRRRHHRLRAEHRQSSQPAAAVSWGAAILMTMLDRNQIRRSAWRALRSIMGGKRQECSENAQSTTSGAA